MDQLFKGAGVALITPFNKNLSVDYDSLAQIVENQISGGMDYLVALGTTAETPTLTENEKLNIVRCVVENADGKAPVIVGMGGNNTQAVIQQIASADLIGVDGLLIVTPYYNKPTQEGLYNHFKAISEESQLPIVLYNVPSRTGVNMEAATTIKLANDFKNIVAVKEASGDLAQAALIRKYAPKNFSLISGDDAIALPMMSVGGQGVISVIANALPDKLSAIIHAALKGDFKTAKEVHLQLIDLIKLLFREGNPAGVKALMHLDGKIENVLRSPLNEVSDTLYNDIKKAAKQLI